MATVREVRVATAKEVIERWLVGERLAFAKKQPNAVAGVIAEDVVDVLFLDKILDNIEVPE